MDCQHGAIEENIALLALLNAKVEPVTQQPLLPERRDSMYSVRRMLTLKHEKQAAEAFAILFANTESPDKVGAVCIEENHDGRGLIVRTATNSGPQTAQVNGLRWIVDSLRTHCKAENSENGLDQFLDDVVAVSHTRLLGRLRSRHALASRKSRKPPILPKLQHAVEILSKMRKDVNEYSIFKEHSKSLVEVFTRLEHLATPEARSESGRELLKQILAAIRLMLASVDLKSVLAPIPRNIDSWSGDARENLIERLKRLAQYHFAAQYLLYAARKYPAFRHIDVQGLCIPTPSPRKHPYDLYSQRPGLFHRCIAGEGPISQKQFVRMIKVHAGKNVAHAEQAIIAHIQQEKRVHAEIQLLFYYEQQPELDSHPRVICSSKYACYLCNLFINIHGRFYIPGSHGRAYSKWRIPAIQELNLSDEQRVRLSRCLDSFNEALEQRIRGFLERQPLILPDPNESIIFQQVSNSPSLLSAVTERGIVRQECVLESPPISLVSHSHAEPRIDCATSSQIPETRSFIKEAFVDFTECSSIRTRSYIEDRPYQLLLDTSASAMLSPGLSVRFHTPLIHVEVSYESVYSLASDASSTSSVLQIPLGNLIVCAKLVSGDSHRATGNTFDLGMHWTQMNVPSSVLFEEAGIAFRRGHELLHLHVLPEGKSGDESNSVKGGNQS